MATATQSILDNKTRTGLSTQVLIYVSGAPVGAIQSFQINQNRQTKSITHWQSSYSNTFIIYLKVI